jgi:hypothetical protein
MEKSEFSKEWILKSGIPIAESYNGNITLRALHYRLVAAGMTNDIAHYKKVITTMTGARWSGLIGFDAFLDHERETIGRTEYEETSVDKSVIYAEQQIKAWATSYHKNKWENQKKYVEVFIEKKALQSVFDTPCDDWNVALSPCKGYPSLTFLYSAKKRFDKAIHYGKTPIILYFGDYDCSGEDIPRSIYDNLNKMMVDERHGITVEVKRIALMEEQVVAWNLPPAPTKIGDTRGKSWCGLGQVELDAVEPNKLVSLCNDAIAAEFDERKYEDLLKQEREEKIEFKNILGDDFKKLLD